MSGALAVRGARIVTAETVLDGADLLAVDGRITAIGHALALPDDVPILEAQGNVLLPGFLDLHIHGGGGADTMDATPEALRTICRTHARYGTTGLLATTMTQSHTAIVAALTNAGAAFRAGAGFCPDGARVLGIHVEGPYISPAKPGAQPREFVRDYDAEEFARFTDAAGEAMVRITIAPERPGADALRAACHAQGVGLSFGHTEVTADHLSALLDASPADATHLFNAMPGIHHRDPGPIPVFLTHPAAAVELIADGHHVAPEVVRMAVAARGTEGVLAITDAMAGAGAGDGLYELGGHTVTVAQGRAVLVDGTLAGSVLTMDRAAANLRAWCGLDWNALAKVTSGNAAARMGWSTKGRLAVGADADFVLVDDALAVLATVVDGRCVFRN